MTTLEAFKMLIHCHAVIIGNTARAVNRAVHRWPWAFIIIILLAATASSFAFIGQARAERDRAHHDMVALQDTIDTMRCQMEIRERVNN